jgi:hypothetical protein
MSGLNDASRSVTASQMSKAPFNVTTIDQFMATQITAY